MCDCPGEQAQNDPEAPWPIEAAEVICRGAFEPQHIRTEPQGFKLGILPRGQLRAGQLSVWRLSQACATLGEIEAELMTAAKRQAQELHTMLSATAGVIRGIRTPSKDGDVRCFCIVGDCICDKDGRKHKAHCNMGFSEPLKALLTDDKDDPIEIWAQEALKLEMERLPYVWVRTVAATPATTT